MTTLTLQTTGYLGYNAVFDIEEDNGIIYVGHGSNVRMYDATTAAKVSSLTWKSYIGKLDTGWFIRGFRGYKYPNGQVYMFIATIKSVMIYNITNYRSPYFVGYINIVGSILADRGQELRDVVVKGNYAYVSVYGGGLVVIDVTNISKPVYVKTIVLAGYNRPGRMAISGNRLYIGCWTNHRLDVFNITTQNAPSLMGSWTVATSQATNSVSSVRVSGNYAYVVEYHNGVHVVDVSNPAAMKEVSSVMNLDASDLRLLGNYGYLSVRYQGLAILDFTTPTAAKLLSKSAQRTGYYEGIRANANFAFLANDTFGFEIFSVSNLTNPYFMNSVTTIGGADSITVKGNILYIGCHNENIWQITKSSTSDSIVETNPILVHGRYPTVKIQGNYLFGAGDWRPVNIVDISNPSSPKILFNSYSVSNASSADGILPDGSYAYVSVYYPTNGLGILNISGLPSTVSYASITELGASRAVFAKLSTNILLMAANGGTNKGLLVIDVTNKSAPKLITTVNKGTGYNGVVVDGNTVFATTAYTLYAYDFTNPSAPTQLSSVSYTGSWTIYALAYDQVNKVVYAGGNQLRSFNASNPRSMVLRDIRKMVYPIYDMEWNNGRLYIADYYYGIYVMKEM